ncbi:MAG TPA: alpha/beta fold hydrolase [Solimonas sp.]|nr:alpha/beta fold hydrolase [Solimonas sp.]
MRFLKRFVLAVVLIFIALIAADYLVPDVMARSSLKMQRAMAHLQLKQARIAGFDMPYLDGGKGEPLVLVHGIGADKDNFDQAAMWLTQHYRVISIDLPGFGEASKPADADYGIDAQVARLDLFMQALGLPRAHFGGSSMGGWIVASYAAAQPDKVQSLWLLGAAGANTAKESEVRRNYRESGQFMLFARNQDEFEHIMDTVFVHRPFVPHSVRHALAARAAQNYSLHTRIFADLIRDMDKTALEDRLAGSQVPALIVYGDGDRAVDPSAGEVLHKLMPNSKLIVMPGVGHLPMLESPRQTAKDYIAFRESLGK